MNWYGPRGDCGCCKKPPPPFPPCACPQNDCLPEGRYQFSGVRVTIDYDDGSSSYGEIRFGPGTSGPCAGKYNWLFYETEISGLSGANGTYDAVYVKRNSNGTFTETSLEETACGLWWLPIVEVPVTGIKREGRYYQDDCVPIQETVTNLNTTLLFDLHNGLQGITIYSLNSYLGLGYETGSAGLYWPQPNAMNPGTLRGSLELYDCSPPGSPTPGNWTCNWWRVPPGDLQLSGDTHLWGSFSSRVFAPLSGVGGINLPGLVDMPYTYTGTLDGVPGTAVKWGGADATSSYRCSVEGFAAYEREIVGQTVVLGNNSNTWTSFKTRTEVELLV